MDKIKEYLEYRLKELDFVLGYFEDEDIKGDINAKITLKEIDQVKNLLVLLSVVVPKGTLCDHSGDETLHQGNGFVYKTCADCGEDI